MNKIDNPPNIRLILKLLKKTIWPTDWNGYEYRIEIKLITPLGHQAFSELLGYFFDSKKTVTIWKYGLINKDAGCDILLKYSASNIELAVRILDPNKLLHKSSLKDNYLKFSRFIYMEYYLFIRHLLYKHNVTHQVCSALKMMRAYALFLILFFCL